MISSMEKSNPSASGLSAARCTSCTSPATSGMPSSVSLCLKPECPITAATAVTVKSAARAAASRTALPRGLLILRSSNE